MRPLLIIRPEPANSLTLARARSMGAEAIALPLFEIRPRPWSLPDVPEAKALLFTSANAVRMAGSGLKDLRTLPVWAVGTRTAAAAAAAGFSVNRTGTGGLDTLLSGALPCPLLHLCGEDRIVGNIAQNWPITAISVYENVALEAPAELAAVLETNPVTLLHSPRAARHYAGLIGPLGHSCTNLSIAALSPAVAEAAGPDWRRVAIAPQTSDEALLRCAMTLIDEPGN